MVEQKEARNRTGLMADEKFYITTAIDYVNGPPHMGHAVQKVWADVVARHFRARGRRVWFLTGTDEYGVNIVKTAERLGLTPKELADENSPKFKALRESLNLSWDDFIRTSDKERHWPGAELMWDRLVAAGDIYKKHYRGLYCVGHEAFITEKDLIDGKCALHQKEPEVIDEENYFFKLSRYTKSIESAIKSGKLKVVPKSRKNEILSLLHAGLDDVSFSRPRSSLNWGIPVPGDDAQVQYVWCDALTNYLSAIGYGRNDDWKNWWPADLHVLGKDNLRFHAAIWPGMLLSAGLPLPKQIFAHGFITVNGQKISKTIGNVVDPHAISRKYGVDTLRYYLLREISTYDDGDFSERKLIARYNGDLANGLGNFAARVLALGDSIKEIQSNLKADGEIAEHVERVRGVVYQRTEEFKFHEALAAIWELIAYGDAYVSRTEPWDIEYEEKKDQAIFNLVVILDNVAALLRPFMPGTAEKITHHIEWHGNKLRIKKGEVLFPRLR